MLLKVPTSEEAPTRKSEVAEQLDHLTSTIAELELVLESLVEELVQDEVDLIPLVQKIEDQGKKVRECLYIVESISNKLRV